MTKTFYAFIVDDGSHRCESPALVRSQLEEYLAEYEMHSCSGFEGEYHASGEFGRFKALVGEWSYNNRLQVVVRELTDDYQVVSEHRIVPEHYAPEFRLAQYCL
jgi:hypothetical protein